MAFSELVAATVTDSKVLAEIDELLVIKHHAVETDYGARRAAIDRLVLEAIANAERMQFPEPACRDSRLLDDFFRKTVLENN